jgi:hypothetical protein
VKIRLKTRPATGTLAYEWKTPASGGKCHGDRAEQRSKSRREKDTTGLETKTWCNQRTERDQLSECGD